MKYTLVDVVDKVKADIAKENNIPISELKDCGVGWYKGKTVIIKHAKVKHPKIHF